MQKRKRYCGNALTVGVAIADGGLVVVAGNDAPGALFPSGTGRVRIIDVEAGQEVASFGQTGTLRAFAADASGGRWHRRRRLWRSPQQ
jgi:hypothetical protein